MATTREDTREAQARVLVDYLRGRGVVFGATREGDGYSLAALSRFDLGDEIRAQVGELKPEILVLLCEEDLFGVSD